MLQGCPPCKGSRGSPSYLLLLLVPQVSLGLWPHHRISASVIMLPSPRICVSNLPFLSL